MANALGGSNADGEAREVEGFDQALLVSAGGLDNDMRSDEGSGKGSKHLEEALKALRTVGESAELGQAQRIWFQGILGNINAKVEGGRVVLAHTCNASWFLKVDRSINGSSSEQLQKRARATKTD